jgi:hypothetical protein
MDAQPLLVVYCCNFVTRDGNVLCLYKCLLDLIVYHVGKCMSDFLACRLRPMFARLMRHIQSVIQIMASTVITHGPA